MKKNRHNTVLALLFIIFLGTIFVLNIFSKDKSFSEMENRTLAQKPRFDLDNLIEGRYTKKYESYTNDQFVYRSKFINIKSSIEDVLKKTDNNGVYKGKEGYLFEEFHEPNAEYVTENIDAINKFIDKYEECNTSFLLAPVSTSVLKEKLPDNAPVIDERKYVDDFEKQLDKDINFIYPYDILRDHKEEYIYYKTDHHWTTLGAYYSYEALADSLDIESKSIDDYNKTLVSNEFYGTLFSKGLFKVDKGDDINLYLPKDEDDEVIVTYVEEQKKSPSLYSSEYLKKRDKYGLFLSGNHPVVEISTASKEEKSLLLIKDSYANSLVPFLTTHYSKIVLIDPRYYYDDIDELMEKEKFTDILFLYNTNTFFQDNSLSGVLNN